MEFVMPYIKIKAYPKTVEPNPSNMMILDGCKQY